MTDNFPAHPKAMIESGINGRKDRRNSDTIFLDTLQYMITADPLTYEKLTA
jgi:hypothetical protein